MRKKAINKTLKSAIILYVTLALLATTFTVGWFVFNQTVTIKTDPSDKLVAVSSGDLKISLYEEADKFVDVVYIRAKQTTDPEPTGTGTVYYYDGNESTRYLIDVTGNGKTMYCPKVLDGSDQPYLDVDNFVDVTEKEGYFIELTLYFKTSTTMDVFLDSQSYVSPVQSDVGSNQERRSMYGDFSSDEIAGAARVAFLEVTENSLGNEVETLKNVWIPNDRTELRYNDTRTSATLLTNGVSEKSTANGYGYYYVDSNNPTEMQRYKYSDLEYANGSVTVGNAGLANTAGENAATPLLHFESDGTAQTKVLRVRIWFEGTDREADAALNGGMIKYGLYFSGYNKSAQEDTLVPDSEIDGEGNLTLDANEKCVYFNTALGTLAYYEADTYATGEAPAVESGEILYSLDGSAWSIFSGDQNPNLEPGETDKTVYVRLQGSSTRFNGNIVTVNIPHVEPEPTPGS